MKPTTLSESESTAIKSGWGTVVRGQFGPALCIFTLTIPGAIAVAQDPTVQRTLITTAVILVLAVAVFVAYPSRVGRALVHAALLVVPIATFYRVLYHGPISPGILASIFSTTAGEATELLGKHPVLTALLALMLCASVSVAIGCWNTRVRVKTRVPVLLLCAALLLGLLWGGDTYWKHGELHNLDWALKDSAREVFPIDVALSAKILARGRLETARATAARAQFKFQNVQYTAADDTPPALYVVAIGESSRRANWSLYGYRRDTTPRLNAIRDQLVLFDNALSNANITMFSLSLLLTRASPKDWNRSYYERSLVTLLRQGGFSVEWISNQDRYGFSENPVSSISLEANRTSFAGDFASDSAERNLQAPDPYDSNLLPRLRAAIDRFRESKRKTVIVLHMMGSHDAYDERYPASFDTFRDHTPRQGLSAQQLRVIDQYDNSVRFTDFILDSVINQIREIRSPAALLFFSDHGERLYDPDSPTLRGHGFPTPSRQELQIPLFAWISPELENERPGITERLRASRHLPIQLENVFETVVDLSQLRYEGRDTSSSLLSLDFRPFESAAVLATTQNPLCAPLDSVLAQGTDANREIPWASCP